EVRALRQRWLREAGEAGPDLPAFTRWLVAGGVLTEYQVGVIGRNNAHQLFLGPYPILDRVGKGRMAGVYKAGHPPGQAGASQVLPTSGAADPPTLARFQREARLALRLRHPNVVRTFHTGQHQGLHYLVMEHLEGETLEEVLQRRQQLP